MIRILTGAIAAIVAIATTEFTDYQCLVVGHTKMPLTGISLVEHATIGQIGMNKKILLKTGM